MIQSLKISILNGKSGRWITAILHDQVKFPRCFYSYDFGEIKEMELHYFSDASNSGYGQCNYIRVTGNEKVPCTLITISLAKNNRKTGVA